MEKLIGSVVSKILKFNKTLIVCKPDLTKKLQQIQKYKPYLFGYSEIRNMNTI